MSRGTFAAPSVVHQHGAFALSWVLLFGAQPLFVRYGALRSHTSIGRVALPLALGVLTSGILFVALVTAGIVARRDRESHARWLLLATPVVIWPAWFRFRHWFSDVPRPDIWFGVVLSFSWIVVAMLRDKLVRGSVHPVLLFGGSAVILEQ